METLYRKIVFTWILALITGFPASSGAEEAISAAEIQHFEQTYEELTGKIIRSIQPKIEFTVLARVELSAHPEKLAAYEESKATHHLPGLPEVTDPNYSHPFESPLLPLLEKKSIKVYFRSALSKDQDRVIREVVQAKLKLTATDSLVFESTGASISGSSSSAPARASRKIALAGLAVGIALIGLALFGKNVSFRGALSRKRSAARESQAAVAPTAIPSTTQIVNANTSTLREALAQERVDIIAKASMNATRRFSHRILGEMDQEKFDLVNQWIERNKGLVANVDSAYARLMLAARIQQLQNNNLLKSIEGFSKMRTLKKELLSANRTAATSTEIREVTA
jgi:hypothetical protein